MEALVTMTEKAQMFSLYMAHDIAQPSCIDWGQISGGVIKRVHRCLYVERFQIEPCNRSVKWHSFLSQAHVHWIN